MIVQKSEKVLKSVASQLEAEGDDDSDDDDDDDGAGGPADALLRLGSPKRPNSRSKQRKASIANINKARARLVFVCRWPERAPASYYHYFECD